MLAKKYRLPVQGVLGKRNISERGRYLTLKSYPSALPYSRFGVVVNKQTAKKATARVALRRALYRTVATLPLTLKPTRDIVILIAPSAVQAGKDAMIKEFHLLLEKLSSIH